MSNLNSFSLLPSQNCSYITLQSLKERQNFPWQEDLCARLCQKDCVLPVYQGELVLGAVLNLKAGATDWQSWKGGR